MYGFVGWGGRGVCMQSRWRHSVTEPHTRWRVCVTMATLWQQQDGGYMLFYIFNSTVVDWTFFGPVLYGCGEERKLRFSEIRELKIVVGLERDEVRWEWRKLHNEELNDLYSSSNIRGIKLRRMRWVGHGARVAGEVHREFRWGNTRERVHSGNVGVDGRSI